MESGWSTSRYARPGCSDERAKGTAESAVAAWLDAVPAQSRALLVLVDGAKSQSEERSGAEKCSA